MSRSIKFLLCLLFLSIVLGSCRDKDWEEYYARPDTLQDPIYQQLVTRGNFKNFLECVDKAGYKDILSKTGYFTLFAPNDEAFDQFFKENNYGGVSEIDSATAFKIVAYSLVYNSYKLERLPDYQSNTGWIPNNAFKRRTAFSTGVYTDKVNNVERKIIATNRNAGYSLGDNNNKYIPYFIDRYFNAKNLTASDYNYFYPNTPYSGFNVVNASVVNADIAAENGMIHEINKVILPIPSIEEYLAGNPKYSVFKELLQRYASYLLLPEIDQKRYSKYGSEPIYVKLYPALAHSPNNENFLKVNDNDGQSDGWSMFVPTNDALNSYIESTLLEHYESFEEMPPQILIDFINAHMWNKTVWPSKFNTTTSFLGEEARFDPAGNVVDAKVLSNGIFYGTNKVQQANLFSSVYGKAYLDPRYSLMVRALGTDLKSTVSSPTIKFTIFMMSDQAFKSAGYDYNEQNSEWRFNGGGIGAAPNITLSRYINLHVVVTFNNELQDLSGEGLVETYGGEIIKYKNWKLYGAGNIDLGEEVTVDSFKTATNGIAYYTNRLLKTSDLNVSEHIKRNGDAVNKPFKRFWDYLKNSNIYTAASGNITGVTVGTFYTVLVPTNAAIQAAVDNGDLPALDNPTSLADKDKVANFILYHIIPKKALIPNGKDEGTFESLYKTIEGDIVGLKVNNLPNDMKLTDVIGRQASVLNNASVLSNRAVIHQIDNYLKYK